MSCACTPKYKKLLLILVLIGISAAVPISRAGAQSLSVDVNLDWIDGTTCYGTANGQPQAYYGAIVGDTVTLHIKNVSSSYNINVSVTESGQSTYATTLTPGSSASPTFPVNSEIAVEGDGSVCSSGHGGPGYFAVEAAKGSVSCSLQSNQVWQVNLNFANIINSTSLYRGGTRVDSFATPKGSALDFPVSFAAQTSAATYYLYYGSSSSSRLLGQATCRAKTASTTAPASASASKPSSSQPSTPTSPAQKPTSTTANPAAATELSSTSNINSDVNSPQKNIAKTDSSKSPWFYSFAILPLGAMGFAVWKFKILSKLAGLTFKK